MGRMEPTAGRHVIRQLVEPRGLPIAKRQPSFLAWALHLAHNAAVRAHGSDSGGYHAFDSATRESAGVWSGPEFPAGSVVTPLAWGRIDAGIAQRVLEGDGITDET